ncbi:MAG: ABC transporter substrate-binding protein [Alphaproteobacteria bacterium]|nr:ABC transporter substrate-binding protein [Alphaproteobacteria bacterium]
MLPVKFVLNWKFQSVQSGFFVAADRGYFADEGIDITIDQGNGSSAAVKNVASGAYDAGFGDINALIRIAAETPAEAPIGVYMIYNQPPFVIVTKSGSGITKPADLIGKTLGAPASDAAYKMFPAFAKLAGIDASKVSWSHMKPALREQMLMRGEVDAVSGYNTTIWFGAKGMGVDPKKDLTFISFADHGMDIYSNSVVVSQKLYKDHPDKVAGLVRAINKGFMDVLADPELAVTSLKKRAPLAKDDIERDRFKTVFDLLVFSDEMKKIGLGAIDPVRMKRSIGIVVDAFNLSATPDISQVFDTKFLPPQETRLVN